MRRLGWVFALIFVMATGSWGEARINWNVQETPCVVTSDSAATASITAIESFMNLIRIRDVAAAKHLIVNGLMSGLFVSLKAGTRVNKLGSVSFDRDICIVRLPDESHTLFMPCAGARSLKNRVEILDSSGELIESWQQRGGVIHVWDRFGNLIRTESVLASITGSSPARTQDNNEALRVAGDAGNVAEVKRLLSNGANPNAKDSVGETALTRAVRAPRISPALLETILLLLDNGADVNAKNDNGESALYWAVSLLPASRERIELVKLLLERGADANVAEKEDGHTVLMQACSPQSNLNHPGITEIVKLLISKGVNVNASSKDGNTALIWASGANAVGVVKLLLEAGANVNHRNSDGDTPVSVAASSQVKDLLGGHGVREGSAPIHSEGLWVTIRQCPCAVSVEALDQFYTLSVQKDLQAAYSLIQAGKVRLLPEGTEVYLMGGEGFLNFRKAKIRFPGSTHEFWVMAGNLAEKR
ncbi:MAG: ankyrin repeat domain-containing protein [Thermodesulfobacteriota bacterium]